MAKSPQGIAFMDSEQRRIGLWSADSIDIRGGFGTEQGGLFDPVDMISDQLDIFILDQTENRLSRFDAQFNFISSFDIEFEDVLYPTKLAMDSRRNFYIYSAETHSIYKSSGISGEMSQFLDLNTATGLDHCVSDLTFNRVDDFALLYSCNPTVHLYARSGKLIRRFSIDIPNPFIILSFGSLWLIINEMGQLQLLGKNPIQLPIGSATILDAIINDGMLLVLTDSTLIIYEISNL